MALISLPVVATEKNSTQLALINAKIIDHESEKCSLQYKLQTSNFEVIKIFGKASFKLKHNCVSPVVPKFKGCVSPDKLVARTVRITSHDATGKVSSMGSGIILNRNYIFTNHHIIDSHSIFIITLRRVGEKTIFIPAVVVDSNANHDTALLKLTSPLPKDIEAVTFSPINSTIQLSKAKNKAFKDSGLKEVNRIMLFSTDAYKRAIRLINIGYPHGILQIATTNISHFGELGLTTGYIEHIYSGNSGSGLWHCDGSLAGIVKSTNSDDIEADQILLHIPRGNKAYAVHTRHIKVLLIKNGLIQPANIQTTFALKIATAIKPKF